MKSPLILLHGAIGASSQLSAIAEQLSDKFDVHVFDFPGHGGKAIPEEGFSIELFAKALSEFIKVNQLQHASVFGYSMGGYVALYLAKQQPGLFKKIITLGTKFHWDEATAAKEVKMLNAYVIEAKVPAFAGALKALHAPQDWKAVLQSTTQMLTAMGYNNPLTKADHATINTPVLILLGDNDKMVTLEETEDAFNNLPRASMMILPDTLHPIDKINVNMITEKIANFCG